jgi:hypothetical protein
VGKCKGEEDLGGGSDMARDYSERGFCMKRRERSKDEELKMKKERWKRVMCGSASRGEIGFGRRVQKHDVAKHLSEVSPFTSLSLGLSPAVAIKPEG